MFTSFSQRAFGAPPPDATWPTFASRAELQLRHEAFRDYSMRVIGVSRSTVMWHRNALSSFVRFLNSTKTAAAAELVMRPQLLEEWIACSRSRNITPVTIRTYWRAMRRFIRALSLQDGLTDPFLYVPAPGVPEHVHKALPPADCERVLATAVNYPWPTTLERHRNVAMLGTALYAGLRKQEILSLEMLDVNIDEGTMRIRHGKGRHGGKPRTAYVPIELKRLLCSYLHERKLRQIKGPEFFASLKTGRGVSHQALKNAVEAVRTAAGIHFSMHVLRHSFVTMLLRSGVPIHVAKELAGHTDIKTTEGYARVFSDDMRRHIESVAFRRQDTAVHERSTVSF
jgi:site-specific recombinase XerD